MKKRPNRSHRGGRLKSGYKIIIAAAGYLLGLAAGIAITMGIPFLSHRADLIDLAQERGFYTMTYYSGYDGPTFGTEFYFYTSNGILANSETSFLAEDEKQKLTEMLPELFEKNIIYKIRRFGIGTEEEKDNKVFCIVAGRVVENANGFRYASIVIRDLNDIDSTVAVFAGLYTVLFATALILLIINTKHHEDFRQLQRDLVSNVSHELKTPITAIKAMGELLYDGMYDSDDDRRRLSKTVLDEADRLKDLVGEILELGRFQSDRVRFEKTKCHADGVFTPVIDRYMMLSKDLGIEVDTAGLDFKSIPIIYTDGNQITKVWNIILDNAMKFAGPGGKVTVSQAIHRKYVEFCIRDNGPGISAEDINRIFERFYKADVTRNFQGSGLGLSIATEIIKGLGERIRVESNPGEGAAFYFTVGYFQKM